MVEANGPASACERSRTTRSSSAAMGIRKGERMPKPANAVRVDAMPEAVIVSTARTPLAKSWKGAFNMTYSATTDGHALQHVIVHARLVPGDVEDVIMGCANPEGAIGRNVARQIAIRDGCQVTTSGM